MMKRRRCLVSFATFLGLPYLCSVLVAAGPGAALWPKASARPAAQEMSENSLPVLRSDTSTPRDSTQVQSVVDDVMSAPEYRNLIPAKHKEAEPKLPHWLERLFEWLSRGQKESVNAPAWSLGAFVVNALVYLAAIVILVLIAIVIVRAILQRMPAAADKRVRPADDGIMLTAPPGELPSDEYVRRAIELAHTGNHKAAIRELLLGTMSWIERAGLIRFRRGLTNRDYLRAVWRRPVCRDSMSEIVDAFDRAYFGRRAATSEMFTECLKQYRRGFTANETVAMAS